MPVATAERKKRYPLIGSAPDAKLPIILEYTTGRLDGEPNAETIAAMREAERIEEDPSIKGYDDLDALFADLRA